MYDRTYWLDHVRSEPDKFTVVLHSGSTYVITPYGTIVQQGTYQDAEHFNNVEEGIIAHEIAINLILNYARQIKASVDGGIEKALATAADQALVSNGAGSWIAKTLNEIKTWLGLKSAAYTESSAYATAAQGEAADGAVPKSLATAADQALVSTGAGAWAVKTLAQIKTWLGLGSAAYKTAGSASGNVPENGASLGTTNNAPVVTDTAGKLKAHSSGALGSAAFYSRESTITDDSGKLPASSAVVALVGRVTPVTGNDTAYTNYMARGAALSDTETTPPYNGQICWQYE